VISSLNSLRGRKGIMAYWFFAEAIYRHSTSRHSSVPTGLISTQQ